MNTLLDRKDFSYEVIERDHFKCVVCGATQDLVAHHVIDRSLFDDGGYYIDNGVAICPEHHLQAERTRISCKELRKRAGITNIVLPEHLDTEEEWDHWGNIVMPTGARLRGELFFQDNVQKALSDGGVLGDFLPYVKYPRTYHLPWSPNLQNDDRMHTNVDQLLQLPLVATIKMDGENTTLYRDYIHARSIDSKHHESRAWIKSLHGRIAHDIPNGWRVCGENMFAKHSIHYQHLKDYFYVFSIWNEKNESLGWHETVEYCEMLGLHTVPVFFRGTGDRLTIENEFKKYCDISPDEVEGYVLRFSSKIPYHLFKKRTAKYVRSNHVHTDKFWMSQPVVPNVIEEGPSYVTDELREAVHLIDNAGVNNKNFDSIALHSVTNNIIDYHEDYIAYKYRLLDEIKRIEGRQQQLGSWSDIRSARELEAAYAIRDNLFGPLKKVALNINGPLPEIAKWRLQIGK